MYNKNQVSLQFNGGVLAITFPNGDFYSLSSDDPRYRKAIAAFNKGDYSATTFTNIMDMRKELTKWGEGKVMITNSGNVVVVKDGVEHEVNERLGAVLKEYVQNQLPVDAFANFVIRLMKNPSMRSRDLFYDFIRRYNMSFTKDGMCRAYKAVTADYKDKHTRKVDNRIGVTTPRFTRAQVDDNPDHACSFGFHCGSIEYVKNFAYGYGTPHGDRIVVVEFDPADVVCVPRDCDQQKIRCTQYTVVEEFKGVLSGYAERLSSDVVYTDEGDDEPIDLEVIEFFDDQDDDDDDVCPACGEIVDPDANYCGFCGERL